MVQLRVDEYKFSRVTSRFTGYMNPEQLRNTAGYYLLWFSIKERKQG